MTHDDLDPQIPGAERGELLRMAEALDQGRPDPQGGFRGELGRALGTEVRSRGLHGRPERLWLVVGALAAAGALLLALAAAQL